MFACVHKAMNDWWATEFALQVVNAFNNMHHVVLLAEPRALS